MKKTLSFAVVSGFFLLFLLSGSVYAGVASYNVPVLSDFSGPYAELVKYWNPMQKGVFAWWNDTIGNGLGVKLVLKEYDTRMDSTLVASMWPSILAECNPIIALGLAGADVAALQQRLPQDKVPVIYGSASYGYGWLPNQWLFQVRPTYVHEFGTALTFFINNHPEKRPVKLAFLTSQLAAHLDITKGVEKYVNDVLEPKGLCKVVSKEYCDINPVDISSQVSKIVDAKADILIGPITTGMMAAFIRACQTLGVNIPTIGSPHHTIWYYAQALKTFEPFEGHMVVAAHISLTDKDSQGYKFFTLLAEKYGVSKDNWNPYAMMGLNQSLLAVRAVEHAARKVGGANLTGQAVYDAMFEAPFTSDELQGTLPTLTFTKDAPFCTKDLKVIIETVKDGKYIKATPDWIPAITDVTKW